MNVRVRLFAVARQTLGADAIDIEIAGRPTIGNLRAALAEQYPQLAPLLPHLMFAVDSSYAMDDEEIGPNAEVACIPPVSGG